MKVLVAIDNKPNSQAILDALVKLRWFPGTEIHLLTVLPPDVEYGEGEAATSADVAEIESLAVYLHDVLTHCDVSFVTRHGDPKTVILELAEEIQTSLIVVGSNFRSTLESLLIGSVSQAVINGAHCPVIVAKAPCGFAQEAVPAFRNVLVPIDNSIYSDAAVKCLAQFQWVPETTFVVAAAVVFDTDFQQVEDSLNKRAWAISRLLNTSNVLTRMETGEPQNVILNLAREFSSDLIVIGSHGHTGLRKMILGSVSQHVSAAAPCAVAIVRGLVADDESWNKTGAFPKLKLHDDYRGGGGSGEGHIMPGGM